MSLDFDSKTGPFPSKEVRKEMLNEEQMAQRTQENLAKLKVHDSDSGGDKSTFQGQAQDQGKSKAEKPSTSTGQPL